MPTQYDTAGYHYIAINFDAIYTSTSTTLRDVANHCIAQLTIILRILYIAYEHLKKQLSCPRLLTYKTITRTHLPQLALVLVLLSSRAKGGAITPSTTYGRGDRNDECYVTVDT